jgi:hypothetical protein
VLAHIDDQAGPLPRAPSAPSAPSIRHALDPHAPHATTVMSLGSERTEVLRQIIAVFRYVEGCVALRSVTDDQTRR